MSFSFLLCWLECGSVMDECETAVSQGSNLGVEARKLKDHSRRGLLFKGPCQPWPVHTWNKCTQENKCPPCSSQYDFGSPVTSQPKQVPTNTTPNAYGPKFMNQVYEITDTISTYNL